MLSEKDIAVFKQIYLEEFGIKITKTEAFEQALKLLNLMASIYRPMKKKENEEVEVLRQETIADVIVEL